MRTLASTFILLLAGFCCVSCRSTSSPMDADDPEAKWSPKEGFDYLIDALRFSFGPVGFAGGTSTGEYAFRAVLRDKDARDIFKNVFILGTEEGKFYTLCGIRVTSPSEFAGYAATLSATNATVTTQRGCCVGSENATDVVKQIEDGSYDMSLTNHIPANNASNTKPL